MKPIQKIKQAVIIFLFVILCPCPGFSEEPILTIDTGGHKAVIRDVMFTKDGRYLVSAGDDKTVRVWDIRTGEIVRVIRGQVGEGNEGKIFAAALSSDDRWLAVGGYTSRYGIRLIDFKTGEVNALLNGHGNVISGLSFSTDGRRLISGSSDKTARIWDVESRKTLHELTGHTEYIYAVAFSPDGSKAVTGSDNNTLKLWNVNTGRLITTMQEHGDDVASVVFTPDGRYILGSWDKTIRLWDGGSGEFIKVLAILNRSVLSLSVTPDSKYALSGIGGKGTGRNQCNVFSIPSGEKLTSFTMHKNIVLATAVSPDCVIAATGGGDDNEIYLWNIKTGNVKHKLAGKGKIIWSAGFSKDGRSIAWGKIFERERLFGHGSLDQSFAIKSGRSFELSLGPELKSDRGYVRGIESVGPWSIRTENGKTHKTLQILKNGSVLHEITRDSTDGYDHRSLTLTSDGRIAVSGGMNGVLTSYNLQTGKKLHEFVGHTGGVLGVACSPDSRFLVSGSSDQTVRLWEIETGKLLLTIFQGTNNEWVAWTPAGYYTASLKGDDYIGWHINQGEDQSALYYPGSRFADRFYSPEIAAQYIAAGGDLDKAVQVVNQQKPRQKQVKKARIADIKNMLPPAVFIQTPDSRDIIVHENKVHIKAFAKSINNKPVKDIWVLINGRRLDGRAIVKSKKQSGNLTAELDLWAPLTESNNRISVIASDKHAESEPEIINVVWESSERSSVSSAGNLYKPDLYLLSIGVSTYQNPQYSLDYADKDAKGIAKALESQQGRFYNKVHSKVLTNKNATKKDILMSLDWIYKESTQKDLAVIFIAGHGIKDTRNNYYFLPHDGDPDNLIFSGVKWFDFQDIISNLPSKVILLADTRHSGSITGKRRDAGDITKALRDLIAADSGVVIMTASTGRELSQKHPDWGHGAFTMALIEGLEGKADYDDDRTIDIKELDLYITKRVKALTNGSQHPTTEIPKTMPNFPVVVR